MEGSGRGSKGGVPPGTLRRSMIVRPMLSRPGLLLLHGDRSIPLVFFAFDVLSIDGASLLNTPWVDRRVVLDAAFASSPLDPRSVTATARLRVTKGTVSPTHSRSSKRRNGHAGTVAGIEARESELFRTPFAGPARRTGLTQPNGSTGQIPSRVHRWARARPQRRACCVVAEPIL